MGPHRSPKTYSFHLPFLRALLPLSLCILSPLPITHAQGEEKTVAITPRTYSDYASGAQNQNTPVGADTLTPGCQSAPYKGSRVCTCPQPFGSAAWGKKTCQDGAGKLWAAGTKRCSKASDAVYTCVPPRGWTRGGTLSGQNICISLNAVGRGTSMCPYYGTVKIESRTPVPPSPPTPQPPPAPVPPPPAPVPPKPTTTVQPPPPPPAPTPPPTPAPVPPPYNPPTPTKPKKPKFVAGGAEVTNLLQPQPTGLGIAVPADPPGDEGPPSVLHGNISRLVVPRKLLFVLTNVNELGNTGVPTGWYLPEVARPYYYFQTAGVQMTFASSSGGNTWIDPLSIVWFAREKQCGRLLGDKEALQKMNNTVSLDDVNPEEYDAVFYAGGNGVMWDVATSPRLAEITRVIYEKGGIVSAVCHGSAGLAMVTLSNGEFLVKGKTLTGLSNNEEAISGMGGVVPFLLEDTLEEVGANYKWRPAWETHVEIDESGRLITGQNYASSSETAIWVISALRTLPDPPGFDARTQGQGSSVTEALGDVPKGFEIQLPKEPPGDEVPPSVSLKNMARLEVPRRLLFVVTNHKELGNTGGTTGWYLPEIARPYYYFLQAGINMTVASPQGGDTPIDPLSLLWFANRDLNARFMADEEAKKLFQNTVPLSRINPNEYDAIFYAGGNGVMWDVATDPRLAQFSKVIYEKGGVIGAVCHGSAGLALIKLSNGEYLVKNRKVTGLTNNEETIASMNKVMPFLLEDKLKEIGANFIWRPEWTTHVEVSGRVISGQNYASSTETAIAIIGALRTLPDPPGFNPATQSQGSSVTDKLDNVPQGFAVELPKDPPGDEAPPTMPLDQVPKLTIPRNLLFVVTGWEDLGKTGGKTGWYLPEIARPYYHFEKAGINLTIASVRGGKTPVDPLSVIWFEREERCGRFLRDPVAMRRMNNTVPLSRINPLDYDGIFYAGGNGVMWDVAINTRLPTIAKTIYERGGIVSSVCHGSAALALIKLSNGEYLVKGKEVTGLTNNEETIPGMQRVMPFLLEDKLKSVGADFKWKPEWVTHVEVSDYGRVISGQNYASSTETAVQVIKAFQSLPKVR